MKIPWNEIEDMDHHQRFGRIVMTNVLSLCVKGHANEKQKGTKKTKKQNERWKEGGKEGKSLSLSLIDIN